MFPSRHAGRMSSVEVTGVVEAPPARVHAILADYRDAHPRILPRPEFVSMRVLEGGVGAGTRAEIVMKVMGATSVLHVRVTEPEPGRVLREEIEENGGVTTFTLTPEQGGAATRVTIATTWPRRPGLRSWVESKINPRVARGLYARELDLLREQARAAPLTA